MQEFISAVGWFMVIGCGLRLQRGVLLLFPGDIQEANGIALMLQRSLSDSRLRHTGLATENRFDMDEVGRMLVGANITV